MADETSHRLYLVEHDLHGLSSPQRATVHRALDEAVRREIQQSRQIRYVQRIYAPAEHRCLCLFEATGPELVKELNETAKIPFTRIVEALDLTP